MGGLKPGIHLLIVIVIGIVGAGVFYSLPKTVVKDDEAEGQSTQSVSAEQKEEVAAHMTLTSEQKQELEDIRSSQTSQAEINSSLSDFFAKINMYDSSAFYAELNAEKLNKEVEWLKTGDLYYQAFSLSLNPINQDKLAEKTRAAYQKALEINPNQLHAKTNMAMTYVNSASPMQAILMLRQVLDQNPNYTPAIMSMGALSMQSGQYDKAVGRFEQVLAIDPGNLNAQLGLAYSLIEVGEKERATGILKGLLDVGVDEVLENEINKTLESLK
ncbi:MAG: tetratricopeptide repeat protein [Cytophagales bacterium]|nr:tetratricopeptide repeat protein [Cytophagales bacterium]